MYIKQTRNHSLDYLCVLAMLLVVLDHFAFMRNQNWFGFKLVDKALFQPLGIIQYGGALGVSIFYIMSGFFFVNAIQKTKSSGSFLLKKLISLWIPYVAAFVLFFCFSKIVGIITPAGRYWWQFSAKDWILSGSLVATFVGSYDKINATWFLIPLIIFFVIMRLFGNLVIQLKLNYLYVWNWKIYG